MTLQRFIFFIKYNEIKFISKTNLLSIIFNYVNINKTDRIQLFDFIMGFSLLSNRCLIKTEDFMFDILSNNGIIRIDYIITNIFNNIVNMYTNLLVYYIDKWDKDKKGYITKDEYDEGISKMNSDNKIILLHLFNNYYI
jgi:hypothetical protein